MPMAERGPEKIERRRSSSPQDGFVDKSENFQPDSQIIDRRRNGGLVLFLGFAAPGLCLVFALATILFLPALAQHKTLIHFDIAWIDIPFIEFSARVLEGRASALWSDQINGGHPLFAEGQGGFAHPLNIIWAAVVTPIFGAIYSANLLHWLLMIMGGIGMIGLCRSLGASSWGSAFAALTFVFAPIVVHEMYVLPVYHTLAWIPWSLWAFENMLKRPTLQTTSLFAGACALVFLAGYPQGLHGTIIYAASTLLVAPFQASLRREWTASWRRRATLILTACAIGVGLIAVQLLPLLELAGLSHRSEGIGITFLVPLAAYLRGLLFTSYSQHGFFYTPGVGSLLVCVLASFIFLFRVPPRVIGHCLAALILLQLGMERASPLFRFVYDNHLLPGLSYFRIVHLYLAIAAIGIGVLAAFAIDHIAQWAVRLRNMPIISQLAADLPRVAGFLVLAGLWIWAILALQVQRFPALHLGIVLTAAFAVAGLIHFQRPNLVAPACVIFLAVECLSLRLHPFNFFDKTVLAESKTVTAIQSVPGWRDFKTYTVSSAPVVGLTSPHSPELEHKIKRMIAAISPMTNLASNLASLNSALALSLRRHVEIEAILRDEIHGRSSTPPGLRLIDLLAVRFVTLDDPVSTAGFQLLHRDEQDNIWTMENTAALPRFQIYTQHKVVDSRGAAISTLKNLQNPVLVIERLTRVPDMALSSADDSDSVDEAAAAQFEVVDARATRYQVKVTARKPVWLFLADANYPGWIAAIDGREVPVFSAQVLGKAVSIPPGSHIVTLKFESGSFRWGLSISLSTIGMLAFLLWWNRRAYGVKSELSQ